MAAPGLSLDGESARQPGQPHRCIEIRAVSDTNPPEHIKNYRWQMRNVDMARDQIIREMMKIGAIEPEKFEEFKDVTLTEMKNNGLNVESARGY